MPLTNGKSIFRQLITLAWPVVLAFMMQTSYNLVDIFWVGKLGATAIAAVSLAGNFFYVILALGQVIGSGTVALVAHSFGARSVEQANNVAKQSLQLAAIVSLVIGVFGFAYSTKIMYFLGGRNDVLTLSSGYLRIVSIGFFFQLLSFSINYIFRGAGDMKIPMYIMFTATLINLILDPLLILGIGFFPRLEVQGAALATTVAKFASFVFGFLVLLKGRAGIKIDFKTPWRIESTIARKIFSVGIPVGISYGLMATSIMVVFGIVASFSEHALAAIGIGTRIFQFASLPVVGIGIATTTLVGQNLGGRDPRGAARTGSMALGLSIIIMLAFSILFILNAHFLISIFTGNAMTISYGVEFISIVAFYLIFVGITTSLTGVFRGAGYTVPPMFAGILKISLLYLTASWLSRTLQVGVTGVWWSMLLAYGIESLVILLWYRRGNWREKGMSLLKGLSPVDDAVSE
jgi:putative MATE family efflux protein